MLWNFIWWICWGKFDWTNFHYRLSIEISQLARRKDDNQDIAEEFELFIGEKIANGFNGNANPMKPI